MTPSPNHWLAGARSEASKRLVLVKLCKVVRIQFWPIYVKMVGVTRTGPSETGFHS